MIRSSLLGCLSLLLLAAATLGAEFKDLADEARAAMAQRNLVNAEKKLKELKGAAKSEAEQETAERLDVMFHYLTQYWQAVHKGGQKLQGTQEIMVGDFRFLVVEYDAEAGKLVLRTEGANKTYTLADMPSKIVMRLANEFLDKSAPQNEVCEAAFLAMDAHGNRALAKKTLQGVAAKVADAKLLLPELDNVVANAVELPKLTPQTAALLKPQLWQLAVKQEKGWKKGALGKQGSQNDRGQLEVAVPDGVDAAWVVLARKQGANFGVRVYLTEVRDGQRLGLFNDKAAEAADAYIELPKGTVKVELVRCGGELKCLVNDEEAKVTVVDAKAAKTDGVVGFSTTPGGKATVAGMELGGL